MYINQQNPLLGEKGADIMSATTKALRTALGEAASALYRASEAIAKKDGIEAEDTLIGPALYARVAGKKAAEAYKVAKTVEAADKATKVAEKAARVAAKARAKAARLTD